MSELPRRALRSGASWAIAAAVLLATFLFYAPVLHFEFIRYDDPNYVVLHPRISKGLTWDNVRWSLTAFEVGNWQPLTLLAHMTDVSLFGMRAGAHHAVNALFHALNAALLFLFFDGTTRRRAPSLVTAGLFAIHPLNVESVAWVSQRKSVLCMFFLLLALIAYAAWARRGGWGRYTAALAACAAALAAKPMAVVLPGLLLALDVWPLSRWPADSARRGPRVARLLLEKAPFAALAVAASIATLMAQQSAGAVGTLEDFPATERVAHAIFAYAWYLFRMVWPKNLSLFYPMTLGASGAIEVAGSAVLLIVITGVVATWGRTRPYLIAGWAWYVVALLPVVGLVQFGTQIVADRYAYLALIGPFAALAFWGADSLEGRSSWVRRTAAACGAVAIVALTFDTGYALAPWRDSVSILSRGVERAPDNVHAMTNLGLELVELQRFEDGIVLLKRAADEVPLYSTVHVNLGYAYAKTGRLDEARAEYETAVPLRPDDANVVMELGRVLTQLGAEKDAEAAFREAVRRDPGLGNAWLFLGTLLYTEGRIDEAESCLERATVLLPNDARSWTAMGVNLAAAGRRADAIAALRKAVALDPAFARARTELDRVDASGDSR
jgi:Flp pilus assembly protein TadD